MTHPELEESRMDITRAKVETSFGHKNRKTTGKTK